jgi:hypothetical protein
MSNAFCTKCGAPLAPGAVFCTSCGQRSEAAAPQPQAAPAYTPTPAQPQYQQQQPQYGYQQYQKPAYPVRKSKAGLIIGIIAAAAVVITGAVLLIVFTGGGGDASVKYDDINGSWEGTLTVKNINTSVVKDIEDFDPETMKDQLNDPQDLNLTLNLTKNGKGTIDSNMFGQMKATYKNGVITATAEREEGDYSMSFSMSGGVSKKGDSYAFKSGTWKMTLNEKEFASGTWEAEMND